MGGTMTLIQTRHPLVTVMTRRPTTRIPMEEVGVSRMMAEDPRVKNRSPNPVTVRATVGAGRVGAEALRLTLGTE